MDSFKSDNFISNPPSPTLEGKLAEASDKNSAQQPNKNMIKQIFNIFKSTNAPSKQPPQSQTPSQP